MAHDAIRVAGAFVDLATKQDSPLNPVKLQKLLYLAQGWHLAVTGKPLFRDPVEAWSFGPVVRSVFHRLQVHGTRRIPRGHADETLFEEAGLAREVVLRVWDTFGEMSGVRLAEISSSAHSPWRRVRSHRDELDRSHPTIPTESIRKQFLALAAQAKLALPVTIGEPDVED